MGTYGPTWSISNTYHPFLKTLLGINCPFVPIMVQININDYNEIGGNKDIIETDFITLHGFLSFLKSS